MAGKTNISIGLIAGVLVILFAVIFYFLTRLDGLVAGLIEEHGSASLNSRVEVEGLNIRLRDAAATMEGLQVGNPLGFSDNNAASLKNFSVAVDPKSLNSNTIVLERVIVGEANLLLEQTSGGNNLQTLLNQVRSQNKSNTTEESGADSNVSIKRFEISAINVTVDIPELQRREQLSLPKMVLQDLGGPNGATAPELARQIMEPLLTNALQSGVAQELKSKAVEKLEEQKNKLLKGLLNKL